MNQTSTITTLELYEQAGLLGRIEQGLTALGEDASSSSLDVLSMVDQFHIRGREATAELIPLLDLHAGQQVLDAGSGLGGPVRLVAQMTGAQVTDVDLSTLYTSVARTLSARTGLADKTNYQAGSVQELQLSNYYHAAMSLHVGINVPDKFIFYDAIYRALHRGPRFVIYDVFKGRGPRSSLSHAVGQNERRKLLDHR